MMSKLNAYSIPIKSMQIGERVFEFVLDKSFFSEFDNSLIDKGSFDVKLTVDKRSSMFALDFDIRGYFKTNCDRCLNSIDLQMNIEESVLVKYDEEEREEAEVLYISKEKMDFNVAKLIFEFIHLNIPISKTKDCNIENFKDCNIEVLERLESEELEEKEVESTLWQELKNIKLK